ncbi:MAG TPA: peptide-N-glycosidase F-related protein, partial [Candidatus Acidoferrum sp.]|nr:peptide-N-glycosidase F-related protein [Candidatus Acidoferrum sp.]
WRKCGINPLSPQAGTWIYDRANWCPGSIVQPDDYDIAIKKGSTHRVAIKMEPYINQKHPTAHYALSTYLFYCKAPWARNDVSLEEIMAPSDADEYSRMNPVCGNPRILVRNSGRNPVTTMTVRYGCPGMKEPRYAWQGNIASQQTGVIELPGAISGCEHGRQFSVTLDSPNGRKDDYTDDNTGTSVVYLPPVYGTDFILALRSNNDSSHNAYAITDLNGAVIRERTLGSLRANTIYYDTLNLAPGCYKLLVRDTAGDGLDFWANPEGGYGYVRLLDMNQRLLKAFTSDFGSETAYWFSVAKDAKPALAGDQLPIVNPFPLRNKGVFTLDLFLNDSTTVNVRIVTEDSSRTVFQKDCPVGRELFLPIDITAEPDGVYYVKATIGEKTISRRIRVRRTN